jgi:hypothetical protein
MLSIIVRIPILSIQCIHIVHSKVTLFSFASLIQWQWGEVSPPLQQMKARAGGENLPEGAHADEIRDGYRFGRTVVARQLDMRTLPGGQKFREGIVPLIIPLGELVPFGFRHRGELKHGGRWTGMWRGRRLFVAQKRRTGRALGGNPALNDGSGVKIFIGRRHGRNQGTPVERQARGGRLGLMLPPLPQSEPAFDPKKEREESENSRENPGLAKTGLAG